MTSTPAKRPRTTDSSYEESFRTVQRKKKQQGTSPPQARRSTPEPTREITQEGHAEIRTRPARIPPLVIEGLLIEMTSPTELRKVIRIPERIRVTRTRTGTFLLHCRTDDDHLEALTHGSKHTSFCVRPNKRITEQHLSTTLQVVVVNFATHIKAENIKRKGNKRF